MERQSSARGTGSSPADAGAAVELSRRKVFGRTVGVAVAGAAGGSVLAGVFASPARAAAQSTTVEQGAVAPAVVALTDAATIAVDASLGNDYRVTIAGNRTMGSPSNATNGQQIVFQVTQGAGGPYTITWGSSYGFSSGLPQPTLSTTAGQTDLLTFIYNTGMGMWLLAAFVKGFSSTSATPTPTPTSTATPTPTPTPTTTTTQPAGTYRLFPSTNGPSSPASYSGSFIAGVAFEVTTGGIWFEGYWWWVCPSGQPTSSQKFALWQVTGPGVGTLISSATVASGTLTAGQWNYVPLATPVPLAIGAPYVAATGFTGGFPNTSNQFGNGGPYSAGITNGPLFAYSDSSGSAGSPTLEQGLYSTAGTDPTVNLPGYGYESTNFWMDVQVSSTAPAGASYRLWPNYPVIAGGAGIDTGQETIGTEFLLSQPCTLDNIWFYSPPGVSVLPSRCAIWNVATQTVVPGTDNTSPSWSGAAGSGWVACAYSGVTIPAGDYKTTIYYGGGERYYQENIDYFSSGPGGNGITAGPLTCPNTANATPPGNSTYQDGPFSYPDTFDHGDDGETRWVDVEVTPQ